MYVFRCTSRPPHPHPSPTHQSLRRWTWTWAKPLLPIHTERADNRIDAIVFKKLFLFVAYRFHFSGVVHCNNNGSRAAAIASRGNNENCYLYRKIDIVRRLLKMFVFHVSCLTTLKVSYRSSVCVIVYFRLKISIVKWKITLSVPIFSPTFKM